MSVVGVDLEAKTLTVSLDLGPWTPDMEAVYRFMCAPRNPDYMAAFMTVDWKALTPQQRNAIAVRMATSGLDLEANAAYFKRLLGDSRV